MVLAGSAAPHHVLICWLLRWCGMRWWESTLVRLGPPHERQSPPKLPAPAPKPANRASRTEKPTKGTRTNADCRQSIPHQRQSQPRERCTTCACIVRDARLAHDRRDHSEFVIEIMRPSARVGRKPRDAIAFGCPTRLTFRNGRSFGIFGRTIAARHGCADRFFPPRGPRVTNKLLNQIQNPSSARCELKFDVTIGHCIKYTVTNCHIKSGKTPVGVSEAPINWSLLLRRSVESDRVTTRSCRATSGTCRSGRIIDTRAARSLGRGVARE